MSNKLFIVNITVNQLLGFLFHLNLVNYKLGGQQKGQNKRQMRQPDKFQTPPLPNVTLSHSNGKVIFDQAPY